MPPANCRGSSGPTCIPRPLMRMAAATTGLRQSELLALRWREVDYEAQRIRVRNAVGRARIRCEL